MIVIDRARRLVSAASLAAVLVGCAALQASPAPTAEPTAAPSPTPTAVPTPVGGSSGIIALSLDFFGDLNYDIYMLDLACLARVEGCTKADLVRITDRPGFVMFPAWSPDGTRIAFTSEEHIGGSYIFTMDASGSGITQITFDLDSSPSWSPDGRQIVFHTDRSSSGAQDAPDIYVMNADGSGLTALVVSATARDAWPVWSPDGQHVAFASDRDGDYEIYSMALASRRTVRLTDNEAVDVAPAWSPDGTQIAYASFVDEETGHIVVMDADGTDPTRVTSGPDTDSFPSWSPDGRLIAFWSTREDGGLFVVGADGSGLRPILLIEGALGALGLGGPAAWKP
jgi:Tol biopolymer transport system component